MLNITANNKTKNGWTEDKALTNVTYPVAMAIVMNTLPTKLSISAKDITPITFLPCSFTVDVRSLKLK